MRKAIHLIGTQARHVSSTNSQIHAISDAQTPSANRKVGSPLTLASVPVRVQTVLGVCSVTWDKYLCLCQSLISVSGPSGPMNWNLSQVLDSRVVPCKKVSSIANAAAHGACRCFGPSLLQASLGGFSDCRALSGWACAPQSSFDAQRGPFDSAVVTTERKVLHLPPSLIHPSELQPRDVIDGPRETHSAKINLTTSSLHHLSPFIFSYPQSSLPTPPIAAQSHLKPLPCIAHCLLAA